MTSFTLFDFFSLCAGLSIFLYGMQQGEKNLRYIGGSELNKIITIITKHRLSAYFAGFSLTMLTQSSLATTVILVGFASAQLLTLGQSLGMILGADLATTFTVSLFAFKFYQIAPLFIAIGYLISLIAKSNKVISSGKLIFALGFVFFGMHMMAESVLALQTNTIFNKMISASFSNSWYGLLAGTLITATLHSSAATLAIVISLADIYQNSTGNSLSLVQLFPIVLGANLGTCATALITTIKADLEGIRVAWAHFFFKFIGIMIAFPLMGLFTYVNIHPSVAIAIAGLHTIFNIFIAIIFLPFLPQFEKIILFLVKQDKRRISKFHTNFISEKYITVPILAISQSVKEISGMSEKVNLMLEKSSELIHKFEYDKSLEINQLDDEVDFLHESIVPYITELSKEELSKEQISQLYELMLITTDIEHIGDTISKNIIKLIQKTQIEHITLSDEGKKEITDFYKITVLNFKEIMAAFLLNDRNIAETILKRKIEIRNQFDSLFKLHLKRLYLGRKESLQTTSVHKDLLEEIQRINHYTFRIANTIIKHTTVFS